MKNKPFKEVRLTEKETTLLLSIIREKQIRTMSRLDKRKYAENNRLKIVHEKLESAPIFEIAETRNTISKRRAEW